MSILFGSETPKLKPGAIKTVGHELHDPRQAPEERHMAPLPTARFAHMALLRSLAGVVQFVTDSFNHTRSNLRFCSEWSWTSSLRSLRSFAAIPFLSASILFQGNDVNSLWIGNTEFEQSLRSLCS